MADDRSIRVRLLAEIGQYQDAMRKAATSTATFGKSVAGHGDAVKKDMQAVGKGALLMAGGLTLALGASVKAAIDWETAWAGVTKTVSGSKSEMADLEEGLRGLSRRLPASQKEIAGVAEAAGQLGIQRGAIVGFTETMVALGVSTNLTADEAATSIAQIANVMGTAQGELDRFGATLVALGNVGASTESEILEMATRLAGAGKLVGASAADVLALANAMTSMGIEAQLGGGAFSRVMLKIFTAVKNGGDKLEAFAQIAGVSADQFATKFQADPMSAIDDFVQGLNRIDAGGGNVIKTLSEVGFKGTQDLQVLLKLKGAGDLWAQSQTLGRKAWKDSTALAIEANKRYETTASQLTILKNNAVDLGIDLGGVLLPALKGVTGGTSEMLAGLQAMPDSMKTGVVGIAGLSAGGLALVGVLGTLGPKVKDFRDALVKMGGLGETVGNNLGKITLVAGGAMAAIALVTYAIGMNAKKAAEAKSRIQGYVDAMKEAGNAAEGTESQITKLVTTNASLARILKDTDGTIHDLSSALSGSDSDFEAFERDLVASGEASGHSKEEMALLLNLLENTRGEVKTATGNFADLGAVEDATAKQTGGLTAAQKEQKKQTEDLTKAIKDMIDAERAALDPLFGMLDAIKGNNDAQDALNKAIREGQSAADLAPLYMAAAKSALDMDAAATQLAGSIASGNVNLDLAKAQLQEWVDNGLISRDTAIKMGEQFELAAAKANHVAGDRFVTFITNIDGTIERLGDLNRAFASVPRYVSTTFVGPLVQGQERVGKATGGWGSSPGRPGPGDVIPALIAPDEFVVRSSVARRYGPVLEHLNATGQMGGPVHAFSGSTAGSPAMSPQAAPMIVHPAPVVINVPPGDMLGRAFATWLRGDVRGSGRGTAEAYFTSR